MKKSVAKISISAVLVISSIFIIQSLLSPKYMSGVVEGAFIGEYYYQEEGYSTKDHDVIFIGDCETYGNFDPMVLWEKYGINAYIRGSAQQLAWQSYYILKDTLTYETPDVVVYNVSPLKYNEPQKEAYNRMTLDGMKWSTNKYEAIKASMVEEESMLDYIFPLLRYHSRWNELESDDFNYWFKQDLVSQNGYYLRTDIKPFTNVPNMPVLEDYSLAPVAMEYLEKIVDLCKDNGIELILIKAPSVYPHWYPQWNEQIEDFVALYNIDYVNFLDVVEEIGIDYDVDTYDAGLHLNLSGANKLSTYFGEYLATEYGLENRQNEVELAKLWDIKYTRYLAEIDKQNELYELE